MESYINRLINAFSCNIKESPVELLNNIDYIKGIANENVFIYALASIEIRKNENIFLYLFKNIIDNYHKIKSMSKDFVVFSNLSIIYNNFLNDIKFDKKFILKMIKSYPNFINVIPNDQLTHKMIIEYLITSPLEIKKFKNNKNVNYRELLLISLKYMNKKYMMDYKNKNFVIQDIESLYNNNDNDKEIEWRKMKMKNHIFCINQLDNDKNLKRIFNKKISFNEQNSQNYIESFILTKNKLLWNKIVNNKKLVNQFFNKFCIVNSGIYFVDNIPIIKNVLLNFKIINVSEKIEISSVFFNLVKKLGNENDYIIYFLKNNHCISKLIKLNKKHSMNKNILKIILNHKMYENLKINISRFHIYKCLYKNIHFNKKNFYFNKKYTIFNITHLINKFLIEKSKYWENIPKKYNFDKKLNDKIVYYNNYCLSVINEKFILCKSKILNIINNSPNYYYFLNNYYKKDIEIIKLKLIKNPDSFCYLEKNFKNTIKNLSYLISQGCKIFRFLNSKFKNNLKIVKEALFIDEYDIKYANIRFIKEYYNQNCDITKMLTKFKK